MKTEFTVDAFLALFATVLQVFILKSMFSKSTVNFSNGKAYLFLKIRVWAYNFKVYRMTRNFIVR